MDNSLDLETESPISVEPPNAIPDDLLCPVLHADEHPLRYEFNLCIARRRQDSWIKWWYGKSQPDAPGGWHLQIGRIALNWITYHGTQTP